MMRLGLVLAVMALGSSVRVGDPLAAPGLAPDDADDSPRGMWQAEGNKGWVRIEPCGAALCGYMFDPATAARGEAILINMRPRAETEWDGKLYSRSGSFYDARITMTTANTLRVQACAVGRFLCSNSLWSRL